MCTRVRARAYVCVCMKKKGKKRESGGRTYPLIQDLFNYGPSASLSRGRF